MIIKYNSIISENPLKQNFKIKLNTKNVIKLTERDRKRKKAAHHIVRQYLRVCVYVVSITIRE
jgi:hypothetical protein